MNDTLNDQIETMKPHSKIETGYLLGITLSVSLFVFIIHLGTSCFAGDGESEPNIDRQLAQLEGLWAAGKIDEYCAQVAEITREARARRGNYDPVPASAKLLRILLDKEFTIKGSGFGVLSEREIGVLSEMELLALNVTSDDNEPSVARQSNGTVLALYLGHIRSQRMPNFKWLPVLANIMPPARYPQGVSPDAISDPLVKSNYLKALQRNHENAFTNSKQRLLASINSTVSSPIVAHMIRTIQKGDVPSTLVGKWMDSANLNDEERTKVKDQTVSK